MFTWTCISSTTYLLNILTFTGQSTSTFRLFYYSLSKLCSSTAWSCAITPSWRNIPLTIHFEVLKINIIQCTQGILQFLTMCNCNFGLSLFLSLRLRPKLKLSWVCPASCLSLAETANNGGFFFKISECLLERWEYLHSSPRRLPGKKNLSQIISKQQFGFAISST